MPRLRTPNTAGIVGALAVVAGALALGAVSIAAPGKVTLWVAAVTVAAWATFAWLLGRVGFQGSAVCASVVALLGSGATASGSSGHWGVTTVLLALLIPPCATIASGRSAAGLAVVGGSVAAGTTASVVIALQVLPGRDLLTAESSLAGAAAIGWLVGHELRRSSSRDGAQLSILAWTGMLATVVGWAAARLLLGTPGDFSAYVIGATVLGPAAALAGASARLRPRGARLARAAIVATGSLSWAAFVATAVIVGTTGSPNRTERRTILITVLAALATAVTLPWLRRRLRLSALHLTGAAAAESMDELRTFARRFTRAIPLDELLLQLAETLSQALDVRRAEVWTGRGGVLDAVAVIPGRPGRRVVLGPQEVAVAASVPTAGPGWLAIWIPSLLSPGDVPVRVAPIVHLGRLLGLIVVERSADAADFDVDDESVLADVARDTARVLHTLELDSALQKSLRELRARNEELSASRRRVVAAADASRRRIERDLHDGAQQHLVSLSTKVGLLAHLLPSDDPSVDAAIADVRATIHDALTDLRTLVDGVFPPLLRDRGLTGALRATVRRLPFDVDVVGPADRFSSEIEATAYFCCVEALQNVAKHGGPKVTATVSIDHGPEGMCFCVRDNGPGFDTEAARPGLGLAGMEDRLEAAGGSLRIESKPGEGTLVSGRLPLPDQT